MTGELGVVGSTDSGRTTLDYRPSSEPTTVSNDSDLGDLIQSRAPQGLKIYRKRYVRQSWFGPRFTTFIRIIPSDADLRGIWRGQLQSCEVQTAESFNITRAFNFQLNRIRDRWHVGIKRSTGYVFFDAVWAVVKGFFAGIGLALRGFVGTKTRFSDLLEGAEFSAKTIEEQRESEVLIFASIAAILRAARFATETSSEVVYLDEEYLSEVKGLTFAGGMAGTMGPDGDAADGDDEDNGDNEDDEDDADEGDDGDDLDDADDDDFGDDMDMEDLG